MRASVLYVQCVAARIWKVKNVFDANRTGSMKPQDLAIGEDPVPLTLEQMRSRCVALPSNPGMAEREPENGEFPDNFIISQGPRNEQSTYHDQGFVEQGTSSFPDSRPGRLCIHFIHPA